MKSALRYLKKFAEHPVLQIVVALILIYSGLYEAWETMADDIMKLNFGAHHGIAILGFVNLFKSLPDIIDGLLTLLGSE